MIDIMLILTNTNSLGLYFDKFCQRVLYTAGNGYRSAQGNVQIGQLFAGQLGGRINRSACFADDQVSNIKMVFSIIWAVNSSVSKEAVPLPIATRVTLCLVTRSIKPASACSR